MTARKRVWVDIYIYIYIYIYIWLAALPPTKDIDLAVLPLCKQDIRSQSAGPIRKQRIRSNCTGRDLSTPPPTSVIKGWEDAPGVPKTGAFINILKRVRKFDTETEERKTQAWRTFLELSAASDARASAASASQASSVD